MAGQRVSDNWAIVVYSDRWPSRRRPGNPSIALHSAEAAWAADWFPDNSSVDENSIIPWVGHLEITCQIELVFIVVRFQLSRILRPFFPVRIWASLALYVELNLMDHAAHSLIWEPFVGIPGHRYRPYLLSRELLWRTRHGVGEDGPHVCPSEPT